MVWTLALSWKYLFLSFCLFSSSRYGQCWCVEPCWTALSPKNIFLQLYLDSRLYVGVILLSCLMAKLVTQRAPSLHTQIEVSRLPNPMKTFFCLLSLHETLSEQTFMCMIYAQAHTSNLSVSSCSAPRVGVSIPASFTKGRWEHRVATNVDTPEGENTMNIA